jgi:hypothetical protein
VSANGRKRSGGPADRCGGPQARSTAAQRSNAQAHDRRDAPIAGGELRFDQAGGYRFANGRRACRSSKFDSRIVDMKVDRAFHYAQLLRNFD